MTLLSSGDLLVAREWALSIHYPLIGPLRSIPLLYNGSQKPPQQYLLISQLVTFWTCLPSTFSAHLVPLKRCHKSSYLCHSDHFYSRFHFHSVSIFCSPPDPGKALSALSPLPSPATVFPLAPSPTVPCFHPLESFPPLDLSPETSHLHALQKSLPLPTLPTPLSCLHPWEIS